MKDRILTALAVLASAVAVFAGSQSETTWTGGTNNVVAATTNSARGGFVFDFSKTTAPCIAVTARLDGSGTPTTTVTFDASVNGSLWITNAAVLQFAMTGTSPTTAATNIVAVGNFPYWRKGNIWNTNATLNITNIQIYGFARNGI